MERPPEIGIVAFAFGTPASSKINNRIARTAEQAALTRRNPVFTQEEITFRSSPIDVTRIAGTEVPTLRIAREAVAWAQKRKLHYICISCALPHLKRCKRDLLNAIREAGATIEVSTFFDVENSTMDEWFDPASTQKRVHSANTWWPREIALLLMPFWLYKIFAS